MTHDHEEETTRVAPRDVLLAAIEATRPPPSGGAPGRIYTFFGCRGGAGTTTLAVNTAAALAQSGPRGVALLDLDVQLGGVLDALDLSPPATLVDVLEEIDRLEAAPLRRRLAAHSSGVYVLSQVGNLGQLGAVRPDRVARLLAVLSCHFDAVIVDGVRDFGDLALAALDACARIVMILTADVAAVRSAARSVDILRELGYQDDKIHVVLNRYHRRGAVRPAAISSRLGLAVRATVANDFPVVEHALNHGRLLSDEAPRARVSRDVENMVVGLRQSHDAATVGARLQKPGWRATLSVFSRRAARARP